MISQGGNRILTWETIFGQVISKSNNYMSVSGGQGKRRIIKNDKIRNYEYSFRNQCRIYKGRGISRPFWLHIVVYESTNTYDLDNAFKSVLDCLQYVGAITNDNLCVGINARKVIDRHNPRVAFAIEELEPTLF